MAATRQKAHVPRGAPLRAHKREALRQPENVAAGLSVPERLLLFCIDSHTDWQQAGVTGRTVTGMMVRGLIDRNAGGRLSLTNDGREVLAALLLGGIPSR